jgi:pyruvate,orthophosphate dikinase
MDGQGVVKIRLLNRGFSVFLPDPQYAHTEHYQKDVQAIAERCGLSYEECHERILTHQEVNPEHGLRGSRLSVIYPDIFKMQVMAIAAGILEAKKQNISVTPSIVIPQKYTKIECDLLVPLIRSVCLTVCQDARFSLRYLNLTLGAMIEVPDGVAGAQEAVVSQGVDFVGFDSNDLTELMFGISKRDAAKIVPAYIHDHHIFAKDPFKELDLPSVGIMLQNAVHKCRETNGATQVTVYGDHCSDKNSLRFLSHIGVDSVCVDPLLVPIAKIAAAQGKILDDMHKKHPSPADDLWHGFASKVGI